MEVMCERGAWGKGGKKENMRKRVFFGFLCSEEGRKKRHVQGMHQENIDGIDVYIYIYKSTSFYTPVSKNPFVNQTSSPLI